MIFIYETKKILKRISPLLLLVIIVAVAATTTIITALNFNEAPVTDQSATAYTALAAKINDWDVQGQTDLVVVFRENFYVKYCAMNANTYRDNATLVKSYQSTQTAFQAFYKLYTQKFSHGTSTDYLLVQQKYRDDLDAIMKTLNTFFAQDRTATEIRRTLPNTAWQGATMQEILDHLYVQEISVTDLTELKNFLETHTYSPAAFAYVNNRYQLAIAQTSTYSGHLSEYAGFNDYVSQERTKGAIALSEYQLENSDQDYAHAFTFGDIYNNGTAVSLFDFMFTNLEMAALPWLMLVIIFSACAFFTDTYQKTIVTSLMASRRRTSVIMAKIEAILALSFLTLVSLLALYCLSGLLFFNAIITPEILCLFNGTKPLTMAPVLYLGLYCLNLLWKILPLITLSGVFVFARHNPRVIVLGAFLVTIAVLCANAFLAGFWFYQFVPFLALDPIRYLGATLLWSPNPPAFNVWYTLPIMLLITVGLYGLLIHNFKKKDF